MPFITQEHRTNPDFSIPGDLCYLSYKHMVDRWKKDPRWTTAHNIYKDVIRNRYTCPKELAIGRCDECAAAELAWQVFFQKHVMPYEDLKEIENGTI